MPKVSIIIPNYNHARFLEQRLQSVLNQTYQEFEVIYLDDNSTDESREIFAKFAHDPHIRKIIFNQKNSGSAFKQWNKGIKEATGEYVWIAESDDYADARFLEIMVSQLTAHPNAGLAYCHSWEVDEDGQQLSLYHDWGTNFVNATRWETSFVNNGQDECRQYLITQNTIPNASAVLLKRSVYECVGNAPENMRICGDWLMWAKMLAVSDVVFVAEPLNYFRTPHPHTARTLAIREWLHLEEPFKVLHYIARAVNLSEQEFFPILCRKVDQWLQIGIDYSIPLHQHYRIYRTVIQIHASMPSYILKSFLLIMFAKLRMKLRIRTRVKALINP